MKGIALLIGLNRVNPARYEGWSGELDVCENDALVMEQYLKKFKYQTQPLLTKKATRANVLDAIDNAAKTLTAGDKFILYYSGHGGQMPDVNSRRIADSGDEADGLDETWCLYDGEIIDDIFFQRWFKFKTGVQVIVLSDSCHSGSVIKNTEMGFVRADPPVVTKRMPIAVAIKVFAKHEKEYRAFNKKECPLRNSKTKRISPSDLKAAVLLMSGCQDNQLSQAQSRLFPDNSLFTAILMKLMSKKKPPTSHASLIKAMRSQMPADQQPNLMTLGKKPEVLENQRPFKF